MTRKAHDFPLGLSMVMSISGPLPAVSQDRTKREQSQTPVVEIHNCQAWHLGERKSPNARWREVDPTQRRCGTRARVASRTRSNRNGWPWSRFHGVKPWKGMDVGHSPGHFVFASATPGSVGSGGGRPLKAKVRPSTTSYSRVNCRWW